MEPLEEAWKQATSSIQGPNLSPLALALQLAMSGVLALHVRFMFRRFSGTASSTDSISRVFPLLTVITTAVIAVVKTSLPIALGMVGALSIVRFRAAIKEPEELVYLFFCIAIGLALGAQLPLLALALVVVSSVFILGMHFLGKTARGESLLLTISGDADRHFSDDDSGVLGTIEQVAGKFVMQRYDVEGGRGQVRVLLTASNEKRTRTIISQLRDRLPDCEMSYVNLTSTV